MKQRGKTLVPRNALALAARQRHAGAHGNSEKAKRQQARQQLQRELREGPKGRWEDEEDTGRDFPPCCFWRGRNYIALPPALLHSAALIDSQPCPLQLF